MNRAEVFQFSFIGKYDFVINPFLVKRINNHSCTLYQL